MNHVKKKKQINKVIKPKLFLIDWYVQIFYMNNNQIKFSIISSIVSFSFLFLKSLLNILCFSSSIFIFLSLETSAELLLVSFLIILFIYSGSLTSSTFTLFLFKGFWIYFRIWGIFSSFIPNSLIFLFNSSLFN